jgi:hypothetical protein
MVANIFFLELQNEDIFKDKNIGKLKFKLILEKTKTKKFESIHKKDKVSSDDQSVRDKAEDTVSFLGEIDQ